MNLNDLKNNFISNNLTLGSIESFTGGLFAATIVSISGASSFFKGAIVTYATEEKIHLLNIDKEMVDKYGVVSSKIAKEMAIKGKDKLNVDVCISFTGNAGPNVMENKSVGEVYLAIAYKNEIFSFPFLLEGDRQTIREKGVEEGIKLLNYKIFNFLV